MRVLALDTTSRAGSLALIDDGRVIDERRGDPLHAYAARLPRDILRLLADHGRRSDEIDLFAVASGPGSFTGLRVGIATMQGLAFVHGRRIAAVSALDAFAQAAGRDLPAGAAIGVWTDAHRGDVFSALYRIAPQPAFVPARLLPIEAAAVGGPATTLSRWTRLVEGEPIVFAGDSALRYEDLVRARQPDARIIDPPPLAAVIGLIAAAMAATGDTTDPADVRPLYVRRPDAVVERERHDRSLRTTEETA